MISIVEIGVGEILGAGKREEYMWEREMEKYIYSFGRVFPQD